MLNDSDKTNLRTVLPTYTTTANFPSSFASLSAAPITTTSVAVLTPNTVERLEQTLLDLQGVRTPTTQAIHGPTMVVKPEVNDFDNNSNSGSDLESHDSRSSRFTTTQGGKFHIPDIDPQTYLVANSRRPTGPRRNRHSEPVSEEEAGKRQQRRERNKVAAAKCRKRREDHAQVLIDETEQLEEEKHGLEHEISSLQQQKEQLEFLLQAHQHNCQKVKRARLATTTMAQMPAPAAIPTPNFRPTSLSITSAPPHGTIPTSLTEATGISVETPSNGVLSLYSIVEGHTGLTPLSGLPPTTPSATLDTPTISSKESIGSAFQDYK